MTGVRNGASLGPGLSRIRAEHVVSASNLVRSGRVYDLGTRLGGNMPTGAPTTFGPYRWLSYRRPARRGPLGAGFQFSMDFIMGSPHQSSHIDGLAHIQAENRIFGGNTIDEALSDDGWTVHGIETVPPIIGRGVFLDIPALEGLEQLPDTYRIGRTSLEAACRRQQVELREGDTVLVRTGKVAEYKQGKESYYGAQPGVDVEGALWLYDQGMALLGTDTSGTEPLPFLDPAHTTHRALIVERGVHLLEILDLDPLAVDQVNEFFFVCSPLKIVGATGSWVRPIAVI